MGPWRVIYVNPADDPQNNATHCTATGTLS
jgi:hypothetical protein